MTRRPIFFSTLSLVLLLAIVTFLLGDTLRDSVVEPLYRSLYILRLGYLTIPQGWQWAVLIGTGITIGFRSLYIQRMRTRDRLEVPVQERSRLESWARWIALAQEGQFFQLHMARKLGDLVLEIMAHREGQSVEIVRENVRGKILVVPDEILKFLDTRLSGGRYRRFQQLLHQFNLGTLRPLHTLGYEPIVDYLESQLELTIEQ